MNKSSLILASLMLFAACSKMKKLDEMGDNTSNMNKTTSEMSATTEKLSVMTAHMVTTTSGMRDTTTSMYQQIRSKEAEDTRNKKFSIFNDDNENIGDKMTAAGVFYKSLEFQFYTADENYEDEHIREDMYLDAANEFTRRLVDVYKNVNVKTMCPTKEGKKNNSEKTFYALAATIHFNHRFQEELVKRSPNVKLRSMYDLVKTALLKDSKNEELKEYEEILVNGINKEIMIELIKARVDMFSALGLKNLTDKRQMTLKQKLKGAMFELSHGKYGTIQLPQVYEFSNNATKNNTEKYLDGAVKARTFLASIGVKKELHELLHSALSNITLNESAAATTADTQDEKKGDTHKEVTKNLIQQLLAPQA